MRYDGATTRWACVVLRASRGDNRRGRVSAVIAMAPRSDVGGDDGKMKADQNVCFIEGYTCSAAREVALLVPPGLEMGKRGEPGGKAGEFIGLIHNPSDVKSGVA